LSVPDPWLSSTHATLERVVGSWVFLDAGSKNGSLVNGQLTRRARLADGDLLELGSTFLVFREALPGDAAHPGSLLPSLPPAGASLPPIALRREDFGLALHAALASLGAPALRFDPAALRALLTHPWPGDLPELARCVAALVAAVGPAGEVTVEHLPAALSDAPPPAPSSAPQRHDAAVSLVLEGEVWTLSQGAELVRLRDGDGPRYLAYLLARSGVEVHALELATAARGARGAPPADAPLGEAGPAASDDLGPLLDARAKEAYQGRIADLREAIDEATRWGDRERAAAARAELEALAHELSRAVGLGGRDRKVGGDAERARVTVTMRLKATMKKVAEASPALGEHLHAAVRTGTFCLYSPRRRG
jgi:hypothetical protein